MALPLTDDEQTILLDALGELVEAVGPSPLLAGPIEPTPAFFPDRYTPTADGARAVAERLLGYAGLESLRADVEVAEGRRVDGRDAAAWFAGIDGFRCSFGVERRQLEDAEALVASLAHEVAHAFRSHHRLAGQGALPEEPATDATTVFLGFGVLTTIATERYRTSGELRGTTTITRWSQTTLGYLPPAAMAFLLAAQALARRAGRRERSRIAGLLESNQAAFFHSAHAALARREAEVVRRLQLPPDRKATPAPRPARQVEQPAPVEPSTVPPPLRTDNRGRRVFRVTGRWFFGAAVAGVAAGALPFFIWWTVSQRPAAALLGALAAAWLGWRVGRRRPDRCSDSACEAELRPGIAVCPGCGGAIAGTIAHANDRLDADERLRAGEDDEAA